MIKVLVEGNTANEMRRNLEAFFASVKDEQSAPAQPRQYSDDDITHLGSTTANESPSQVEATITTPPPIHEYHKTKGALLEFGVDSRGIPWDERIHSAGDNKTNKNGTWRQRRGVEPKLVEQVEQELLQRMKSEHTEVASPAIPQQVPNSQPIAATPVPLTVVPPVMASMPASIPQPVAPPPLPPQPVTFAHTKETFREQLIPTLAKLTEIGKLTEAYITQLKGHFGVDQIWKLTPEQTDTMFESFVQHGLLTRIG